MRAREGRSRSCLVADQPNTSSSRLWHPVNGIQFLSRQLPPSPPVPRAPTPFPLYPSLNLARLLHLRGSVAAPDAQNIASATATALATEGLPPDALPAASDSTLPVDDAGIELESAVSEGPDCTASAMSLSSIIFPYRELSASATARDLASDSTGSVKHNAAAPGQHGIQPPQTDIEFKIDPEAFWRARHAPRGSPQSFWSHMLYRGPELADAQPPEGAAGVHVDYCTNVQDMERVSQLFVDAPVIGLDLEWFPFNRKGMDDARALVSLIQIATPSRIALFHLARFPRRHKEPKHSAGHSASAPVCDASSTAASGDAPGLENDKADLVAPTFRRLMADPGISKTGVAIKGDCSRLRNALGVEVRSLIELSHLFRLVKYTASGEFARISKALVALAVQMEAAMGLPIRKDDNVRRSNWMLPLNEQQLTYAAADAYANVQLFHVLDFARKALVPAPPPPPFAELNLPILLAHGAIAPSSALDPFIDLDESAARRDSRRAAGDVTLIEDLARKKARKAIWAAKMEAALANSSAKKSAAAARISALLASSSARKAAADLARKPALPKAGASPGQEHTAAASESRQTGTSMAPTALAPMAPASASSLLDPRVAHARQRMSQHRLQRKPAFPRVAPAALQAYFLWSANPDLEPAAAAALLRTPPLKTTTVAQYIASVALAETALRCDPVRLRTEVLSLLPPIFQTKYDAQVRRGASASSGGCVSAPH